MRLKDPNRPEAEVVLIAVETLQAMRSSGSSYGGDMKAGASLLRGYDERTLTRAAVWIAGLVLEILTRRHGPVKVLRLLEGWRLEALVAMPADVPVDGDAGLAAPAGGGDDC